MHACMQALQAVGEWPDLSPCQTRTRAAYISRRPRPAHDAESVQYSPRPETTIAQQPSSRRGESADRRRGTVLIRPLPQLHGHRARRLVSQTRRGRRPSTVNMGHFVLTPLAHSTHTELLFLPLDATYTLRQFYLYSSIDSPSRNDGHDYRQTIFIAQ